MRDIRHGEHLWYCWEGEGYFAETGSDLIYFTVGHVDFDTEVVTRALASTLQRDGIVDSLADGFRMLENSSALQGHVGILEGESVYYVCDEDGETEYGDKVQETLDATWVEL
jgi:hypothetical protein